MKTTRKDRYEHKLKQFLNELDSLDRSGVDSYVALRTQLYKKYGFTDVDYERAIGLTLSKSERHYYCDGIGIKKDVKNKKEKAAIKLERDLMSGKQQFFDEVGEATNLMDIAADNYVFGAERAMETIVEAMNAKCEGREPECPMKLEDIKYDGTDNSATVSFTAYGDKMSIEVRGWGLLTGPMKMSPEDAAAIQDSLGQFIVESVNEANNITTDGEHK